MRLAVVALLAGAVASGSAAAQSVDGVARRIDKLESELRAVQRKVFPGGDTRYFEPEFTPEQQAPAVGTPASSPIADLSMRVDALERQLATLTGQSEQNGYQVKQLQEELRRFREDTEFRLAAIEDGEPMKGGVAGESAPAAPPPAGSGQAQSGRAGGPTPAPEPQAATTQAGGAAVATATATAAASPAAAADPVEAQYQAAYKLVQDKDWAKAEPALQAFIAQHPKSARASHAQFWLGRSYAAQGSSAQAAKAFLDNYRTLPRGERAPDSLLWLGKSLQKLGQPSEACRAYNELEAAYAGKLSEGFRSDLAQARTTAKCPA